MVTKLLCLNRYKTTPLGKVCKAYIISKYMIPKSKNNTCKPFGTELNMFFLKNW